MQYTRETSPVRNRLQDPDRSASSDQVGRRFAALPLSWRLPSDHPGLCLTLSRRGHNHLRRPQNPVVESIAGFDDPQHMARRDLIAWLLTHGLV